MWHTPSRFNKNIYNDLYEKVKVIIGIRNPISQNVSELYQKISSGNIYFDWILGELENKKANERKWFLQKFEKTIDANENIIEFLWENFIRRYVYSNIEFNENHALSIQKSIQEFSKYILDITKYPFNKEKGYTVIKEGNIEVFVYQLEKLNCLVPELSEWVGVTFSEIVRGNDASDKWISDSYKQAQKEIEITQEYFDRCYSEPYVQHCYSQEDIEKFKARGRTHIKKKS